MATRLGKRLGENSVKAWVNFDGTSADITGTMSAENVTAITDSGVGNYVLTLSGLPDANYAVSFGHSAYENTNTVVFPFINSVASGTPPSAPTIKSATQLAVNCASANTATRLDLKNISVVITR